VKQADTSRFEAKAQRRFDRWSSSHTLRRLKSWLSFVQQSALDRLDWPNVSHILDVGCGSGWAVFEAAACLDRSKPGFSCGCDLSLGMLQQREKGSDDRSRFAAASGQSLPFADSSFDALVCTAAFHHFPDPHRALEEFRRVLRPAGQLIVVDTCRDLSPGLWIWDRLHRWFEKGHVQYYRVSELVELIQGVGFEDLSVSMLNPAYSESRKLFRKTALFSAREPKPREAEAG